MVPSNSVLCGFVLQLIFGISMSVAGQSAALKHLTRAFMSKLLSHVLNLVNSTSQELGVERDWWRFRIAPDPRLYMDELQGRAFCSFYSEEQEGLRELLKTLRNHHHFVLPHDIKIDKMSGHYLVMYLIPGPGGRRPVPEGKI